MKFVELQTLKYDSEKETYLTAGMVVLNVDDISKITHYEWEDKFRNRHSMSDIWTKNGTHQDTLRISSSTLDDLKAILKVTEL